MILQYVAVEGQLGNWENVVLGTSYRTASDIAGESYIIFIGEKIGFSIGSDKKFLAEGKIGVRPTAQPRSSCVFESKVL